MKIEDLPHYVKCPDCEFKHFLSINRDAYGNWSAGYVGFGVTEDATEFESVIPQLYINEAETLDEIALRLSRKVEVYKKIHG